MLNYCKMKRILFLLLFMSLFTNIFGITVFNTTFTSENNNVSVYFDVSRNLTSVDTSGSAVTLNNIVLDICTRDKIYNTPNSLTSISTLTCPEGGIPEGESVFYNELSDKVQVSINQFVLTFILFIVMVITIILALRYQEGFESVIGNPNIRNTQSLKLLFYLVAGILLIGVVTFIVSNFNTLRDFMSP